MFLCYYLLRQVQLFCAFLASSFRNREKDDSTLLPTLSPARGQNFTINVFCPPNDSPTKTSIPQSSAMSTDSSFILYMTSNAANVVLKGTWVTDKEQFLRRPSLSRAGVKTLDDSQRCKRNGVALTHIQPEIYIQDWSSSYFQLDNPRALTPGRPRSLISSPPLSANRTPGNSQEMPRTPSTSRPPIIEVASVKFDIDSKRSNIDCISQKILPQPGPRNIDKHVQGATESPTDVSDALRTISFKPIQRVPSALSARSGFIWDPPSNFPACMVPVPLYTSTPPRPSSHVPIDQNMRLSLLPYPDLFDFAMYDSRASQESFSNLPMDIANTFEPPTVPVIAYQDRYRSSAFSRISGQGTPTKSTVVSVKAPASHNSTCTSPYRGCLTDVLPLSPISFNVLEKGTRLSGSIIAKCSSADTSEEWNVTSFDDISARLRAACDDLSKCMWTDEEFLKIISG